jgi:hypothetical protein
LGKDPLAGAAFTSMIDFAPHRDDLARANAMFKQKFPQIAQARICALSKNRPRLRILPSGPCVLDPAI